MLGPNEYLSLTSLRDAHGLEFNPQHGGILYLKELRHISLRHNKDIKYYKDEVSKNARSVIYTLQGKSGDQDFNAGRNKTLLAHLARRGTLYFIETRRVPGPRGGKGKMIHKFHGEYRHDPTYKLEELMHPGEDGKMRKIYRIRIVKV